MNDAEAPGRMYEGAGDPCFGVLVQSFLKAHTWPSVKVWTQTDLSQHWVS